MSQPSAAELVPLLATVLARVEGGPVEVSALRRLSGGASRQTWSFTATTGDGTERPLVLQRERPGGMRSGAGMGVEAALVRAAAEAGVPVPALVVADGDAAAEGVDLGGPWLVAEHVAGETIARRILRDDAYAPARGELAAQCGRALAAIHRIPLESAPGLDASDQLAQSAALLDSLGQAHPALELALRWLSTHRPARGPVGVVHGDFRIGNLVVGADGLRGVLDWELAHAGEQLEDLGWLCVRAWRFGSPRPVGGFGERAELVAAYEAAGGAPVDAEALHWWELAGTVRWGVICIVQASTHLLGLARSVELAAIGRRVCEAESDALALLGAPRPAPVAPAEPPPAGPHDVPTAAGLLEAVREYLTVAVSEATEGQVRFHARVAGNVVAMVERELALGPAQAVAHARRLADLGFPDDVALAAAIRAGELDGRWDEVLAAVAASVADKLAVANPTYAVDDPPPASIP